MTVVRLAIIGCGAAAEQCHLPASGLLKDVRVVALVDKDLERARRLGRRFGIERCVSNVRDVAGEIDGAIIAVPNHLHAPVARELVELRKPVLVEKPLARTTVEAQGLVTAARAAGVPLQVGHMYRFGKSMRLVKRLVSENRLGALRAFSASFGTVYERWPIASGFPWSKEQAGGGVLMDVGPHVLDLLLWWLGDVDHVEYWDDSLGGVEADCKLVLGLKGPSGTIKGDVLLSRLRALGTVVRIIGESWTVECDLAGAGTRVWPSAWDGDESAFVSSFRGQLGDPRRTMYAEQLRAFGKVIKEGGEPEVSGETVLRLLALIDRCYLERKPLAMPWQRRVAVGAWA